MCFSPGSLSAKYHPEIKWKEISNERFIVVFPKGYEETAAYTLETASRQFKQLHDLWGHHIRIRGHIRILLTDAYDDSNGVATFFPYNHITLYLFNPPPDSVLGSYHQWLDMVLSHELTHIMNYNTGSGLSYFLRHLLGNNPAFFPLIIAPRWIMEGMAIYGESQLNRWGRLDTPDFRLMLRQIAAAGNLPDWTDILGNPTPWPGANTPYLYGAAFTQYLAETYGHEKIPEFMRIMGRFLVPVQVSNKTGTRLIPIKERFKLVFGKRLGDLWDDFNVYLKKKYPSAPAPLPPRENHSPLHWLTASGKQKMYPITLRDSSLLYVENNDKEFPAIYRLFPGSPTPKRIRKQAGIDSMFYHAASHKVYYSASEYYKTYYRFSDIYLLNPDTGQRQRLTKGKRLSYPIRIGQEPYIYCVKRIKAFSYLCRYNFYKKKEEIISKGFPSIAFLSPSPDGQWLAASIKEKGKNWSVALFNRDGSLHRILTKGIHKSYNPCWKSQQELFFIIQHQDSYRLALYSFDNRKLTIYEDSQIPALKTFTIGPESHIIGTFFSANGFNLGTVNPSRLKTTSVTLPATSQPPHTNRLTAGKPPESSGTSNKPAKNYRFLRDLFPKYISPTLRKGGSEHQPGLLFSGHDVTGEHIFSMQGFYGFSSHRGGFQLDYVYDGFYPTLTLSYSDLSGYYSQEDHLDYIHNEQEFQLSALTPLAYHTRQQWYFYTDLHLESVIDAPITHSLPPQPSKVKLNGIKAGLFFNSARNYYDSFSLTDGVRFSLSYSGEMKFLGSDYRINTAAFEYKQYIALPRRPHVLALRFCLSDSWGEARRLHYMGGSDSHLAYHTAGDDLFDLQRGYPSGYFTGTGGWLINAEYRLSLFKVEEYFLVFRSLERLYMNFFADIGNLWFQKKEISPAISMGIEVGAVIVAGDVRMNVSAGIAFGQNPYHAPIVYLRIGNSF